MARRSRISTFAFLLIALSPFSDAAAAGDTACADLSFEETAFTVCTADPAAHDIRLHLKRPDGTPYGELEALPRSRLLFAMNAGMFSPSREPAGLYVENGKKLYFLNTRRGGGNFHLLPNGVFWMKDGEAAVTATESFAKLAVAPDLATQSGPMLVIDGQLHPKFDDNGPSRTIRNGVGIDASRRVVFAIAREAVSFGRFARLFRDRLGCANALYLDGSISRLFRPGDPDGYGALELGPMFAVYGREK